MKNDDRFQNFLAELKETNADLDFYSDLDKVYRSLKVVLV